MSLEISKILPFSLSTESFLNYKTEKNIVCPDKENKNLVKAPSRLSIAHEKKFSKPRYPTRTLQYSMKYERTPQCTAILSFMASKNRSALLNSRGI